MCTCELLVLLKLVITFGLFGKIKNVLGTLRSFQVYVQKGNRVGGIFLLDLDDVHVGVDCWHVVSVLLLDVGLLEPALLGEHVEDLVLDDVHLGVDCRRVVSVLLFHVVLLEPALHGDHLVKLVLGPSFLILDLTS